MDFLTETIAFKANSTPKIVIKYHKKVDFEREFPTHLLVPAINFTQAFPKINYQKIRDIFDREKVYCMK